MMPQTPSFPSQWHTAHYGKIIIAARKALNTTASVIIFCHTLEITSMRAERSLPSQFPCILCQEFREAGLQTEHCKNNALDGSVTDTKFFHLSELSFFIWGMTVLITFMSWPSCDSFEVEYSIQVSKSGPDLPYFLPWLE